ncbi:hypothetical protein V5799_013045, partial [Amblyomma americanum]
MLEELKSILSERGANLKAQCVQGSTHICQLPRQLQQWNRVLGITGLQLRERNKCGELAVVFFRDVYRISTSCRAVRSVLLFHWLLMNHRCVTALLMERSGFFHCIVYTNLFCDAVAKCTGLRNLQICGHFLWTSACEELLHAVQSLPNIEEIVCNDFYVGLEYNNMTALAHVIRKTGKLNRFAIEDFGVQPNGPCVIPGMCDITAALVCKTAISDLSIE